MRSVRTQLRTAVTLALLLSACTSTAAGEETQYSWGTFEVTRVEAPFVTSLPAEVDLIVHGEFPDDCTEIFQVSQERGEGSVSVVISTRRPLDQSCAQVVVPHTETVRLGEFTQEGLYVFDANGVQVTSYLGLEPTPEPAAYDAPLAQSVATPDGKLTVLAPLGWATLADTGTIVVAASEQALTDEPIPSAARLTLTIASGPGRAQDFGLDGGTLPETYALFIQLRGTRAGPPTEIAQGDWQGLAGHRTDPRTGDWDLRALAVDPQTFLVAAAFAPTGEWDGFQPLVEAMLDSLTVR
jgi:hypothetical protein